MYILLISSIRVSVNCLANCSLAEMKDRLIIFASSFCISIFRFVSVSPFQIAWWIGRVFRVSKNYNKPEIEDRIIIECKTGVETFIFTGLLSKEFQPSLDKKQKNWFLLSQHLPITVTKSGSYTPQMSKQELMVLKDLDDYLIFSNKISSNKINPTKYFIISDNTKFVYEFNDHGTESPDYIINNAQTKILESPHVCKRIIN